MPAQISPALFSPTLVYVQNHAKTLPGKKCGSSPLGEKVGRRLFSDSTFFPLFFCFRMNLLHERWSLDFGISDFCTSASPRMWRLVPKLRSARLTSDHLGSTHFSPAQRRLDWIRLDVQSATWVRSFHSQNKILASTFSLRPIHAFLFPSYDLQGFAIFAEFS